MNKCDYLTQVLLFQFLYLKIMILFLQAEQKINLTESHQANLRDFLFLHLNFLI